MAILKTNKNNQNVFVIYFVLLCMSLYLSILPTNPSLGLFQRVMDHVV